MMLAVPAAAVPALLTGACTGGAKSHGLTPAQAAAADQARTHALAAEHELVGRYDAAALLPEVRANKALTDRLAGIRAEHAAHVAALREGMKGEPAGPPTRQSSPSGSPSPGTSLTTAPPTTAPPMDTKTAVAALVKAEQDAADRLTADVLATEGHTAQLLASISAAESSHAALLLGEAS
jgi:rubrerythrin